MGRFVLLTRKHHKEQNPYLVVLIVTILLALPLFVIAGFVRAIEGEDIANIQFEAEVPAPILFFAASADGADLLVADEEARFTFLPDGGAGEHAWTAPATGHLAAVDPALGEIEPVAKGAAVLPDGSHWSGAIAYEDAFAGRVFGFARWSDEPIWTFNLQAGPAGGDADQPRALASGGPYHAVGTEKGKVYLLTAVDDAGGAKRAYRTYSADNLGTPFSRVNDVALSADGKRILIGTDVSGTPSLHLFTDTFFRATFKRITEPVHLVAISDDGTRGAAVTGNDATTRLHFLDLAAGKTLWETGIGSSVLDVALSADGKTMIAGTKDGSALVFLEKGMPNDREAARQHTLGSSVHGVGIANDGRAMAAATKDGILALLDVDRPRPLWSYDAGHEAVGAALGHNAEVLALATRSTDAGRVIVTAAEHALDHVVAPQPRLLPGVTNTIPIVVANNGNRMEHIAIEWGDLPYKWSGLPSDVFVAPGEQSTLNAQIAVPKGQAPGTYALPLTLVSGTARIPVELGSRVPEVTSGRGSIVWSLDAAVPTGAPAAYIIRLENTGNTPNEVHVGYRELPAGWRAEILGPAELRMAPGEDRDVVLKVFAPKSAKANTEAWFDILLAWQHGEETLPVTVKVVDAASYRTLLQQRTTPDPNAPLPDAIGTITDDLETAADVATSKSKSKDSPLGLAVPVLALLGLAYVVARRRV